MLGKTVLIRMCQPFLLGSWMNQMVPPVLDLLYFLPRFDGHGAVMLQRKSHEHGYMGGNRVMDEQICGRWFRVCVEWEGTVTLCMYTKHYGQ